MSGLGRGCYGLVSLEVVNADGWTADFVLGRSNGISKRSERSGVDEWLTRPNASLREVYKRLQRGRVIVFEKPFLLESSVLIQSTGQSKQK